MHKLFAGILIPDHLHSQEYITLTDVDFQKDVEYLKKKVAEEIKFSDANNLEIIADGRALKNELKLASVVKPNGVIQIFKKTKQYEPYTPSPTHKDPLVIRRMQELVAVISHIQLNVTSRVTILQKILNEYPEFRRNMGAQAIIRDSVLFNTVHQNMEKITENYPIICEAAPFIVDKIKKEFMRGAPPSLELLERCSESSNSSEEENPLGASTSNETGTSSRANNEDSRIRAITRQQLQNALASVDVGNNTNSINSLSNIAQRNVESSTSAAPLSSSASGERISAEMFRQQMARAFSLLGSSSSSQDSAPPTATTTTTTSSASEVQPMDTSDTTATTADSNLLESDTIPACYRNHEYAEQLRTMLSMGFLNHEENLTYLTLSNGNIGNAVNLLMGALNE